MITQTSFKRLILRAVLRKGEPHGCPGPGRAGLPELSGFDEVFRTLLDWDGLGFSFHIPRPGVHQVSPWHSDQVHWTLRGAHLLLQTRTKVLNNGLEENFRDNTRCCGFKLKPRDPGWLLLSNKSWGVDETYGRTKDRWYNRFRACEMVLQCC